LASLAANASATLTLVTVVDTGTGTSIITNTATLTASDQVDPVSGNDSDSAAVAVTGRADLAVTKSDSQDPVFAGNSITYTVTVTNNGPHDATGVILTDTLPSGVTFVSANASPGGSCPESGGTVTCTIGNLSNGGSATATIIVGVPSSTAHGATLTNTASATRNETDPNTANNTGITEQTTANRQADLAVTKSDSPDPVRVGATLTYTISVVNLGPSDATGVSLTDVLPTDNASFVSVTSTQGECSGTTTVSCVLGELGASESAVITVLVTSVPPIGSTEIIEIVNTANATANEADPDIANNSAVQSTRMLGVDAIPTLSLWPMVALAGLLIAISMWHIKRRRPFNPI
jgi:uncharacterized repeat protein (TIGR01451 family)